MTLTRQPVRQVLVRSGPEIADGQPGAHAGEKPSLKVPPPIATDLTLRYKRRP